MNYPEFVKSRFKGPEQTAADLACVEPQAAAIHHAILGLVGEWFEYKFATDEPNRREELGDFLFYLEALAQQVNLLIATVSVRFDVLNTRYSFSHFAADENCQKIERAIGTMLDLSKKQVMYRKPIEAKLYVALLTAVWEPLCVVVSYHGYTIPQLQSENFIKLSKRYPTGYTNAAANARADKV